MTTSPDDLERQHTLSTATTRYDELRMRDALAAVAGEHGMPLTQAEALEMLALSEVVTRKAGYGRQSMVRAARDAGASWTQIGAALGTTKQSAWEAYNRWAEEQARA
ncbi:hypothetical protein JIG36_26630 [Actinoplanes sp. LDG1-06]|uniref:Uncharacterized protein n=1 Tax=Paractinoplanes ovalisporus TaxID=2810368 RepID=A0ABS2AH36_9ACTN|nr:hypothetical protein [Actinoplanes ovalisporus]MBM2619135.1 hypothetical protein [Actinoplanes ovalisporus]